MPMPVPMPIPRVSGSQPCPVHGTQMSSATSPQIGDGLILLFVYSCLQSSNWQIYLCIGTMLAMPQAFIKKECAQDGREMYYSLQQIQ